MKNKQLKNDSLFNLIYIGDSLDDVKYHLKNIEYKESDNIYDTYIYEDKNEKIQYILYFEDNILEKWDEQTIEVSLKQLKTEWEEEVKVIDTFIDHTLYKQKLDKKERGKIHRQILIDTIRTRYILNIHKTFSYYANQRFQEFGDAPFWTSVENLQDDEIEEQLKLIDSVDSEHLDDEADVILKLTGVDINVDEVLNTGKQDVVKTLMANSQLKDYNNPLSSAKSLIIVYLLSILLLPFLLFSQHIFLAAICIVLPIIAYSNHNYLYEITKRKALYDKDTDNLHRNKMYTVDLIRQFVTSGTLMLVMGYIIVFLLPESVGNFQIRGILIGISLFISLVISTWFTNFKRVQIDRKDIIDEKYTYVSADEVWLPENSIFKSDMNIRHPIVGFVEGNVKVPFYLRFQNLDTHALIMGGTGSGKTALIILPLLIQFFSYDNTGVIVIDPKGDLIVEMISIMDMFKLKDAKISKDFYTAKYLKLQELENKSNNMKDGYARDKVLYEYYTLLKTNAPVYVPETKSQMIFDPLDTVDCPYFNPLKGNVDMAKKLFMAIVLAGNDENSYFDGQAESLLANTITVLKALENAQYINDGINPDVIASIKNEFQNASILTRHVNNYLNNMQKMQSYNKWAQVVVSDRVSKNMNGAEDMETALAGMIEYASKGSKLYEHTSKLRATISKLISNKYLNFIYNPTANERKTRKELNFEDAILNKDIIGIAVRQEILGQKYTRVLGLSLILTLQEVLFSIPVEKRQYCQLFIDEFQVFANDDMGILFNQGRSYKVCLFAATQALAQIEELTKGLREIVLANTFTKLLHSTLNAEDTNYFMRQAGESESVEYKADKIKINTTTGFQDENAMLAKTVSKKNNLEFDKMNYGQDQYGFAMSRYVLARRKPQYIRMAFLGDWVSQADVQLKKKLEKEYVINIKTKEKKYLVSNLASVSFSSTGINELISRKGNDEFDASAEF